MDCQDSDCVNCSNFHSLYFGDQLELYRDERTIALTTGIGKLGYSASDDPRAATSLRIVLPVVFMLFLQFHPAHLVLGIACSTNCAKVQLDVGITIIPQLAQGRLAIEHVEAVGEHHDLEWVRIDPSSPQPSRRAGRLPREFSGQYVD